MHCLTPKLDQNRCNRAGGLYSRHFSSFSKRNVYITHSTSWLPTIRLEILVVRVAAYVVSSLKQRWAACYRDLVSSTPQDCFHLQTQPTLTSHSCLWSHKSLYTTFFSTDVVVFPKTCKQTFMWEKIVEFPPLRSKPDLVIILISTSHYSNHSFSFWVKKKSAIFSFEMRWKCGSVQVKYKYLKIYLSKVLSYIPPLFNRPVSGSKSPKINGQWNNGIASECNKWLWIKFQFVQEAVENQEGHCPHSSSATSKIHQLQATDAARTGSCFHSFFFFLFHI